MSADCEKSLFVAASEAMVMAMPADHEDETPTLKDMVARLATHPDGLRSALASLSSTLMKYPQLRDKFVLDTVDLLDWCLMESEDATIIL